MSPQGVVPSDNTLKGQKLLRSLPSEPARPGGLQWADAETCAAVAEHLRTLPIRPHRICHVGGRCAIVSGPRAPTTQHLKREGVTHFVKSIPPRAQRSWRARGALDSHCASFSRRLGKAKLCSGLPLAVTYGFSSLNAACVRDLPELSCTCTSTSSSSLLPFPGQSTY